MWCFVQQKWLCSKESLPSIDYFNALCQKIKKKTDTSVMKTMATKTPCAMKQRGTELLSPVFGNSKINGKKKKTTLSLF